MNDIVYLIVAIILGMLTLAIVGILGMVFISGAICG